MIDPTGHEAHLDLDPPDESDELDLVYSDLEKAQLDIKFLKDLCLRAANALESTDPKWEGDFSTLIAELRKAGQ